MSESYRSWNQPKEDNTEDNRISATNRYLTKKTSSAVSCLLTISCPDFGSCLYKSKQCSYVIGNKCKFVQDVHETAQMTQRPRTAAEYDFSVLHMQIVLK